MVKTQHHCITLASEHHRRKQTDGRGVTAIGSILALALDDVIAVFLVMIVDTVKGVTAIDMSRASCCIVALWQPSFQVAFPRRCPCAARLLDQV